jgi:hypothetical protein
MEIGELVGVLAFRDDRWSCPFKHKKGPKHKAENVMPPVDGSKTNDASKLSKNLEAESYNQETLEITLQVGRKKKKYDVQYTAHHLIPGNESWPETDLLKWVDDSKGEIVKDIGYDINDYTNGTDLPGIHGIGSTAWSASSENFKKAYAFGAMKATSSLRQFHDRHPAYSDFVVKVLDKIALKLEQKKSNTNYPGCGRDDCGGTRKKPYEPPYGLLSRLEGVALRLEGYLTGSERTWRKPIITSRFSLMYKKRERGMTEDEAREELKVESF